MSRIRNLCDEKNKNNIANSTLLAQSSYQGCFYFPLEFKKNGTRMALGATKNLRIFIEGKICVSILLL